MEKIKRLLANVAPTILWIKLASYEHCGEREVTRGKWPQRPHLRSLPYEEILIYSYVPTYE